MAGGGREAGHVAPHGDAVTHERREALLPGLEYERRPHDEQVRDKEQRGAQLLARLAEAIIWVLDNDKH